MSAGKHKLELTVLGTTHNASSDTTVIADAFRAGGVTIDETANALKYNNWAGKADANASDGKYRFGNNARAVARFTFTGTSVEWLTATGPNYGQAQVWLDETDMGVFDFYAAAPQWQVVRSFTNLSSTTHTLEIKVLGTKHANSTGKAVIIDAFRGPFH